MVTLEHQLWEAAGNGTLEEVKHFCSMPNIDINYTDAAHLNTPFFRSCLLGNLPVVKYLLEHPEVNVMARQREKASPFFIACQEGHLEVVKLLLADPRIDVNLPMFNNAPPVCIASQNGFMDIVRVILASPRDISLEEKTSPGDEPWSDMTPVQITRWSSAQPIFRWEKPAGYTRRMKNCPPIADLLQDYIDDRVGCRHSLRCHPSLRGDLPP